MISEAIEAVLPHVTVAIDPFDGVVERLGVQPAWPVLGIATAHDEARCFEHLEVLGDCLQADVERFGQLVHGRLAAGRQPSEDRPAGRIGERCERDAERVAKVVFVAPLLPFVLQTDDNPMGVPREYIDMSANLLRSDVPMWCENNAPPFFGVNPTVSAGMTDWGMRQIISTPVKVLYDTMVLGATTDFRVELADVVTPVLILHGDADASTPLELTGRPTAAIVQGAELVAYEGAGHGIYATHHRQLAAKIADFARPRRA